MAMSKMQEQDHHLEWNKIQSIGMMNQRQKLCNCRGHTKHGRTVNTSSNVIEQFPSLPSAKL
jgi:hypothetical protein